MNIAELYSSLRDQLLGYLRYVLRVDDSAEDILHDVFLRLLQIDRIDAVHDTTAYIYQALRNRTLDSRRKHRELPLPDRYSDDDELFLDALSNLMADESNTPESVMQRDAIIATYEDALQTLPDDQRQIYIATEYEGKTFSQIAQETGLPLNTLLSRKHRAVKHLRQRIESISR